MSTEKKLDNYFGADDELRQDLERIRLQSRGGLNRYTASFLDTLNLPAIQIAVDIGTSGGETLPILAERASRVIAIDNDTRRLKVAKGFVSELGISDRVDVQEGDVLNLNLPDASVDMVYTRLFWQHFPEAAREKGISEAIRILKPGGYFIAEDLTMATWQLFPPLETHKRLLEAFLKTYEIRGAEPSMGAHFLHFFEGNNSLEQVGVHTYVIPSFGTDPYKMAHVNILKAGGIGVVKAGLMSQEDWDRDFEEFRAYILQPSTIAISPVITQIAGRKK
jgi:SAM-dependent methyltransferase